MLETVTILLIVVAATAMSLYVEFLKESTKLRRIQCRDAVSMAEWRSASVDCKAIVDDATILCVLQAIASVIDIEPMQLLPCDDLADDLTGTWLLSPDDPIEPFRNELYDRLGTKWDHDWRTVEDVVLGVFKAGHRVSMASQMERK